VLAGTDVGIVLDGRDGDRSPIPATVDTAAREHRVPVERIGRGDQLQLGPIRIRVLWPPPLAGGDGGGDPNDRAVVAEVAANGARVLLAADAESNVLSRLDLEPVDVLKVSHHGSRDPGLPAILERLRPRVALIEVGRHNTYGHPAQSTLRALAVVPEVRRTDRDGSTGVDLSAGGTRIAGVRVP
jgi:competence protein ComEC